MKHNSGSRGMMTLHDLSKNTSVPASEEHISNMPNPGSVCQSDNLVFGYREKCSILVETIATIGYFKEIRVLTNSVNVDREPKFLVQNLRKPARFHSLTSAHCNQISEIMNCHCCPALLFLETSGRNL